MMIAGLIDIIDIGDIFWFTLTYTCHFEQREHYAFKCTETMAASMREGLMRDIPRLILLLPIFHAFSQMQALPKCTPLSFHAD